MYQPTSVRYRPGLEEETDMTLIFLLYHSLAHNSPDNPLRKIGLI